MNGKDYSLANEKDAVVLLTTLPDHASAIKLANRLVSNNLAACCNLLPSMQSVYYWDNQVTTDSEHQMLIKTRQHLLNDIQSVFKDQHPYDVPEFVVVSIDVVSSDYKAWLNRSVKAVVEK